MSEAWIETACLLRMKPDKSMGLDNESDYTDYWLGENIKRGTKYTEDHDLVLTHWCGVQLAEQRNRGLLALGELNVIHFKLQTRNKLSFLHHRHYHPQLIDYFEQFIPNERLVWMREPGFEYEGNAAWLLPSPNPAVLFRKDMRYYVDLWLDAYEAAINDGTFTPHRMKPPKY